MLSLNNKTLKILISQAIWALGQAGLIFAINEIYGLELVADYILALAIFTPLTLFFSKNARNLLAVDAKENLNVIALVKERVFYALLAFSVTMIFVCYLSENYSLFGIVTWLVLARVSDQIADICFGYYQRENLHDRIAYSQVLRGVSSIVLIIISYTGVVEFFIAAVIYSVVNIFIVFVYDIYFVINKSKQCEMVVGNYPRGISLLGLYPFFDTLHLNSLRYIFVFLLTKEELGYLGLAQTLYMPVQLFITACGYIYITQTRILFEKNGRIGLMHLFKGVFLGSLGAIAYLIISLVIPSDWWVYVFPDDPDKGKEYLLYVSLIMLFLGASGFISQVLIVKNMIKGYSQGPIIGLIVFLLLIVILWFSDFSFSYQDVLLVFSAAVCIRFIYVFTLGFVKRKDSEISI